MTRTQTWTLDPLGNWDDTVLDSVTESRVHNDVNELTARTVGQGGAIDLSYDDAGNLIQDGSANGDHKYTWDYRNRLLTAQEKQDGNWNTVGTYKYDPPGRRVRKAVTNKGGLNGTTRFVWGGDSDWQCLEERDADDDLVARFTYSPGYIDAVALQERDLNDDDDFSDANEVAYYEANTLFSVYVLSDADGSVIERYRFDAYGGATVLDADGGADADGLSDVKNPYTFTARRLDPESGLMQYRNRYYSAVVGRFVSRDPAGYRDGWGLYAYVSDRPARWSDPLGLFVPPFHVVKERHPGLPVLVDVVSLPPDSAFEAVRNSPHMPAAAKACALASLRAARRTISILITGSIWNKYDAMGMRVFSEGIVRGRQLVQELAGDCEYRELEDLWALRTVEQSQLRAGGCDGRPSDALVSYVLGKTETIWTRSCPAGAPYCDVKEVDGPHVIDWKFVSVTVLIRVDSPNSFDIILDGDEGKATCKVKMEGTWRKTEAVKKGECTAYPWSVA